MTNKERFLQISYEHKLSHIGSGLTALPGIEAVYQVKKPNEKFILSNGHAGLALYVVLEEYYRELGITAEDLLQRQGIHPDRSQTYYMFDNGGFNPIDCSTGSLGQGLPIAVGMAMADRSKNVYCMISDGEAAEGSIWESLRIAQENKLTNLKVILNANGWGAYRQTDVEALKRQILAFGWYVIDVDGDDSEKIKKALDRDMYEVGQPLLVIAHTNSDIPNFANNLDSHYKVMNKEDYGKIKGN